ncbi:type II secretion system major pseudopilin GspG [Trichlorobacter lovleyi]|jgi:general secretion pathway protein G|uniref:Type II secretion system core protein G n=1 Tax=Trichlorobacter lovleyi (strain ATCC BAA-1151 / DSM 17278 / SZ) TaxID=398767 RepID=B3E7L8_TRIL1|nr:type II secretion system major pseudopilin GspG [Trichlorobacter lovleyi]ACD95000.1 general secretion pathway protein G [Trichlorobacter lovleyi SZ]
MQRTVNNRRGFTLIEIMVVIVILALLAALVGPKIIGRSDDAKLADAKVQIRNLETALKLYKLDNGNYPTTEQGMQALLTKPTTGLIPKNYRQEGYLESKKLPTDPWGGDYIYLSPGEHGDYDLCSLGSDGVKGGEGKGADICNWNIQ